MAACSTACRAPGTCGRSMPASASTSSGTMYQNARVTSSPGGRSRSWCPAARRVKASNRLVADDLASRTRTGPRASRAAPTGRSCSVSRTAISVAVRGWVYSPAVARLDDRAPSRRGRARRPGTIGPGAGRSRRGARGGRPGRRRRCRRGCRRRWRCGPRRRRRAQPDPVRRPAPAGPHGCGARVGARRVAASAGRRGTRSRTPSSSRSGHHRSSSGVERQLVGRAGEVGERARRGWPG